MNRYWIETYGCQMNKAESTALENGMLDQGWSPASRAEEADLVILNTCSVRETAEERVRGRIGSYRALKKRQPFTLVVMGCMAERLKDRLRGEAPEVDLVVGTFQKQSFLRLLRSLSPDPGPPPSEAPVGSGESAPTGSAAPGPAGTPAVEGCYEFASLHAREGDSKAFVPIMHGCDNFCSYCIVPYVRGREVSRDPEEVFAELEQLFSQGVREVTLLGQNVNSYRFPTRNGVLDFPGLLEGLFRRFPHAPWVRFLTSHPKDFSPRLIRTMAEHRSLCRHIHLPVQHGSDAILAAMNRKYTREEYIRLVRSIREALPGVSIGTDILIGFPGETEEDFRLTLDLMEELRFDDAFTYHYNPREGTRAFGMPDTVPREIKLERLDRVIRLQRKTTRERRKERLGGVETVLVEGVSRKREGELLARTEKDDMVVFPGRPDAIGGFARVRLAELRGNTFRGEPVG